SGVGCCHRGLRQMRWRGAELPPTAPPRSADWRTGLVKPFVPRRVVPRGGIGQQSPPFAVLVVAILGALPDLESFGKTSYDALFRLSIGLRHARARLRPRSHDPGDGSLGTSRLPPDRRTT